MNRKAEKYNFNEVPYIDTLTLTSEKGQERK